MTQVSAFTLAINLLANAVIILIYLDMFVNTLFKFFQIFLIPLNIIVTAQFHSKIFNSRLTSRFYSDFIRFTLSFLKNLIQYLL